MAGPVRLEDLDSDGDARRFSPSAARNRSPILDTLRTSVTEWNLPAGSTIVEIASGTGEHSLLFSEQLTAYRFQPTERDPEALASIVAWQAHSSRPNWLPPTSFDLTQTWPSGRVDAILAINLLHIAPWPTTLALFRHASEQLRNGQPLWIYGAVFRSGEPRPPSNEEFDANLRAEDPALGVRTEAEIRAAADAAGLSLASIRPMPNNNSWLSLSPRAR